MAGVCCQAQLVPVGRASIPVDRSPGAVFLSPPLPSLLQLTKDPCLASSTLVPSQDQQPRMDLRPPLHSLARGWHPTVPLLQDTVPKEGA